MKSTQAPPHTTLPVPQDEPSPMHVPATQAWPVPHARPQTPQFARSVWVFTHAPAQDAVGEVQPGLAAAPP
jgi:hypothetical protein